FTLVQDVDSELLYERLTHAMPSFDIVVPVHNGGQAVITSLSAVIRHRPVGTRVLVIDDASTDPRIVAFLDELAGRGLIELRRNEVNQGYTVTINTAIQSCTGDVLIMNSDAMPGPLW